MPVDREAHDPAADLQLARDPVDTSSGIGSSPACHFERPSVVRTAARRSVFSTCGTPSMSLSSISSRSVSITWRKVGVVPDPEPAGHVARRRRQQPDAHLGDDAVVRLHEHLVRRRAETALVDVRRLAVRDRPAARPHQLAVGEDDLHPALHHLVLPVGQIGDAVVEGVADHAAPAEVGDREPQLVPACLDRLVEVEPPDARLDDGVAELAVDMQHAVHPPQVDDDRAAHPWRRAAVPVVLADPGNPERHVLLVRDPDDRLDLFDRAGLDDGGGLVVVPVAEPEWIAVLGHVLRGREDVLGAHDALELPEGGGERALGDRRWKRQGHVTSRGSWSGPEVASI